MGKLKVDLYYPHSDDFDFETQLVRLDLDKEREKDICTDNGFIISDPISIKKDVNLKDPNGMFSPKFGQTIKDLNPFANKYKCECGHITSRINNGTICPICNTEVKYVDDNFSYFGWKVLNDYYVIHPNLFKSIEAFIGKDTLEHILVYEVKKDADGHIIENKDRPEDEPFFGIGMIEFKERFDEVMTHYGKILTNPTKKAYYQDIMDHRDIVFTQSIPYYSTLLRPIDDEQKNLFYEDSNAFYYMINRLAAKINKYDESKIMSDKASLNKLLYDIQVKYQKLYSNIEAIIEKKKGNIRDLLRGRFNFSSRCVITANLGLRIDEIKLPYQCLVEMLQQRIINILCKMYSMSYSDAYTIWYKANIKQDPMVVKIINSIIESSGDGRGIPFIINRNPTIAYGGILQMFCVGIADSYTMEIPLRILVILAADFDRLIMEQDVRVA